MSKEQCNEYKKEFEQRHVTHGYPVRLEKENVENWYRFQKRWTISFSI